MPVRTLLAVLLLLVPAAHARASTVALVSPPCSGGAKYGGCDADVVVAGEDGEANRFSVAQVGETVEVRDAGSTLRPASPSCSRLPDGGVACPAQSTNEGAVAFRRVQAGDGDDEVTVVSGGWLVDGGPGADRLIGNDSTGDSLTGGPGTDVLQGRGGDDLLIDGEVGAEDTAADRFDGGAGLDRVRYAERSAGIRIDLAAGRAGEDALVAVEGADGGRGADVLLGDGADNELVVGAGDTADGGAGDDQIAVASDREVGRLAGGSTCATPRGRASSSASACGS